MTRGSRTRRVTALLVVALLLTAACGGGRDDDAEGESGGVEASPGITDTEIHIGGSLPFSGPASAFGTWSEAAKAYFNYVNETQGGVKMGDGRRRKLKLTVYDDAYQPPRTVENVKRLVEQDKVFALHGVLGTPTVTAIWDYVEQQRVPNLFVLTGATKWGADLENHRYTIGGLLAYSTESLMYVDWLKREMPGKKAAILYQNDDFGKDYLNTIEKELAETDIELVAKQTYETSDADITSQVTNLSYSGADIFFLIATGKFPAQAIKAKGQAGWKATTLMHSPLANIETVFKPAGVDNALGIIAAKYLKEPGDPRWDNDPAIVEYKELLAKYGSSRLEPVDLNNLSGWFLSEILVKVLERTKEPTREALIDAVRNLDNLESDLLLPGITLSTSEDDGFLFEQAQLVRFDGTTFKPLSDVIDMEGKTPTEDVPGVK